MSYCIKNETFRGKICFVCNKLLWCVVFCRHNKCFFVIEKLYCKIFYFQRECFKNRTFKLGIRENIEAILHSIQF